MKHVPTSDGDQPPKVKQDLQSAQEAIVKRIAELEGENHHLKSLLLTDELTGLYNRRFFFIQLEVEAARTRRTGQPCTLMIMDLDDFKAINETFGRDVGDRILVHMVGPIWKNIRPTDFACRIDNDEFAIIMPASGLIDGIEIAKHIQVSLEKPESREYPDIGKRLSASFGLAIYESISPINVNDFFKQAELKMREAKKAGKNNISCDHVLRVERAAVNEAEREALSNLGTNFE